MMSLRKGDHTNNSELVCETVMTGVHSVCKPTKAVEQGKRRMNERMEGNEILRTRAKKNERMNEKRARAFGSFSS